MYFSHLLQLSAEHYARLFFLFRIIGLKKKKKKIEAIVPNLLLNIHLATVARPQRTSVFKASILHSFFFPIPGNFFSGMIKFKELALNILSVQLGQTICVKSISMSQEFNLNLYSKSMRH